MAKLRVLTNRLNLIAGTAEIFRGDVNDRALIEQQLQAVVPAGWPPAHYEPHVLEFCLNIIEKQIDSIGWALWYMVLRRGQPTVIGDIGFKGIPNLDGVVEIGYSVLPEFQRAGYATEAVAGLVNWAFSHHNVKRVIAKTYRDLSPSIRVLEKNGFVLMGQDLKKRLRYELTRESACCSSPFLPSER